MEFLILYVIGYLAHATIQININPSYVSSTKIILACLFYPFIILFHTLNLFLNLIEINLKFSVEVFLSEKEKNQMTDDLDKKLSDAFDKFKNKGESDEEK